MSAALVYISGATLAVVVIMVFVNSRRVQILRDDVDNLPTAQAASLKDTSLATGLRGVAVPKSYYWVDVVEPVEAMTASADGVEKSKINMDLSADTDAVKLIEDIKSKRVTFIYRPEKNFAYRVEPAGDSSFVVLKSSDSPDFISSTSTLPEDGRITLIGLPEGVLNAQSA